MFIFVGSSLPTFIYKYLFPPFSVPHPSHLHVQTHALVAFSALNIWKSSPPCQ
uniref:Uncharacterized protein n=1 Tax=Anguilla anguilla TaxID=7936 RepID=A0A0E9PGV7_ANGAN